MGKVVKTALKVVGSVALAASGIGAAFGVAELSTFFGLVSAGTLSAIGAIATSIGFAKKPRLSAGGLANQLSISASPSALRSVIFGETWAAGQVIFRKTVPGAKKKDPDTLIVVLALAGYPASELLEVRLNGETVWTGSSTTGPGAITTGTYAGELSVWYRTGDETTAAFTQINADAPEWAAKTRTLRGIPAIAIKLTVTNKLDGKFEPLFRLRGAKLYDPRKDTAQGGSGTHNIADPTTWEWSDNAALAVLSYVIGPAVNGRRIYGIGDGASQIDLVGWQAEANICDELVSVTGGGTIKRYTCDGILVPDQDHRGNLVRLLSACAGQIDVSSGIWRLSVAADRTPVDTIIEADVHGVPSDIQWSLDPSERTTRVRGQFLDRQQAQLIEYPTRVDATLEAAIGEHPADVALPFTADHRTAQRISKIVLGRANAGRSMTIEGHLRLAELQPGDIVTVTYSRYGITSARMRVDRWALGVNNDGVPVVTLSLSEDDVAWYTWSPATDEATLQSGTIAALPDVRGLPRLDEMGGTTTFRDASPPASPQDGWLWRNTTTDDLWRYNGDTAAWELVATEGGTVDDGTGAGNIHLPSGETVRDTMLLRAGITVTTLPASGTHDGQMVILDGTPPVWYEWDATTSAWLKRGPAVIDDVPDGTTYGRPLLASLTAGQVDLAKAGVINKIADNIAESATRKWAGESGADVTAPRLGTLLINGSFETGTSEGWTLQNATVNNDPANAHQGSYVLRVASASGGPDQFSDFIPATAGDRLLVTCWAKRDETSLPGSNAVLRLREYDGAKALVLTGAGVSVDKTVSGYQHVRLVYTVNSTSAEFVRINFEGGAGPSGHWFVDEFAITPLPKDADIDALQTTNAPAEPGADATAGKDLSVLAGRTADKITYVAGGTVDSLRPAEAGAEATTGKSLTVLADRIADNISETATRKWAAESGADVTGNNKALAIDVPDTRNTDSLPSFYRSKGVGLYSEFKARSTLGWPGTGTFVQLFTEVKWSDTTGGRIAQWYTDEAGDLYKRIGASNDASWGAWVKTESGAEKTTGKSLTLLIDRTADNIAFATLPGGETVEDIVRVGAGLGADLIADGTSKRVTTVDEATGANRAFQALASGTSLASGVTYQEAAAVQRRVGRGLARATGLNAQSFTFDPPRSEIPRVRYIGGGKAVPDPAGSLAGTYYIRRVEAANATTSGFDLVSVFEAITAGSTTTVTDTGATGSATTSWVIEKTSASEAFDDKYTYQYDVTVNPGVPNSDPLVGADPSTVEVAIDVRFTLNGAWTEVTSLFYFNFDTVNSKSFLNETFTITQNGMGVDAAFRVRVKSTTLNGGSIPAFDSVTYETSGTATVVQETMTPTSGDAVEIEVLGGEETTLL